MSELVNNCLVGLREISSAPPRSLRKILLRITRKLVKAIAEVALNICIGIVRSKFSKKERAIIKSLSSKTLSLFKKRRLILKNSKLIKRVTTSAVKHLTDGASPSAGSRELAA